MQQYKANNSNSQLKIRSEVGFPIKGSIIFPLNSSRLELRYTIAFLLVRGKVDDPTINSNVVTRMQYDDKNENSKYEYK